MSYFLPPKVDFFPHPLTSDDDGLLAIGSRLDEETLLLAYRFGIFPWTSEGQELLWWYTHPRCILLPEDLRITKSMRPYLNGDKFEWTIDTAFREVIYNCRSTSRKGQDGTWLFPELMDVMISLHERGVAHSVEVWADSELVGGLYGLSMGKIFFGESMFAKTSNASKYGFIKLVQWLEARGFWLIDCQQRTQHLLSLGAHTVSGAVFFELLKKNVFESGHIHKWKK